MAAKKSSVEEIVAGCLLWVGLAIAALYFLGKLPALDSLLEPEATRGTPTPAPLLPSVGVLRANAEEMTDAQWKAYARTLRGRRVEGWTGWVEDVREGFFGGYEVWIDLEPPDVWMSVQDVYFDVPREVALLLKKDQRVVFSGTVDFVDRTLGAVQIKLKEATIAPAP